MASGVILQTEARGQSRRDRQSEEEKLAAVNETLKKAMELRIYKQRVEYEKKLANASAKQKQKLAIKDQKQRDKLEKQEKKNADTLDKYQKILREKAEKETLDEQKRIEQEVANYRQEKAKEFGKSLGEAISSKTKGILNGEKLLGNLTAGLKKIGSAVEDNLDTYAKYMSSVEARLQGAGKNLNYTNLNKIISKNTAANPYVKYTAVLDNLATLVDQGIADNVAQRAFLMTISDKIATTFDAANASLLQIVRLQRQDSTAARLGLEANLTRTLNNYFGDTSYLSDTYDSIQASLIDISSQLNTASSIELEYQVQKWLGALGSVGVDSNTLQSIASGINALGTGDVETLSSNSALQNLFVMAAKRAGLNYANMLTGGVSASDVNSLMKGVVEYIQSISTGTNNVVKKQYAQLFGMTMSDMKAFQNISDEVIGDLYQTAMTYKDTLTELNDQLSQVGSRMHLSEKITNVFENLLTATGMNVANNALAYGTYKAFDMLESITGGIEVPFITAFGNGVDLNMSLEGIAKAGIIGIGAASALISGLNAATREGGMLNYEAWSGADEGLYDKDTGFQNFKNVGTLTTTKSSTNYVTSGNSTGIKESLADTQNDEGKEVSGTEPGDGDEMIQIMKFLQEYFTEGGTDTTKPLKVSIQDVQDGILIGKSSYQTTNSGITTTSVMG